MRFLLAAVLGLSLLCPRVLLAQDASSLEPQPVPLPEWVRSGEVNDDGAVVFSAADERSKRRGTVALGTRLPVVARTFGVGCHDFRFVQVGVSAFICERDLSWSKDEPFGVAQPVLSSDDALLPHDYRRVLGDAAVGYAHPSDHDAGDFAEVFEHGFGVAVSERVRHAGIDFVRTQHGYYVREDALSAIPPSTFAGVWLGDALELSSVGFRVRPRVAPLVVERDALASVLPTELVRPSLAAPPADLAPSERWIDVDISRQTLVVYEGGRPLFATLVSTGRAGAETPKGEFRIWAKLATSDMNDTSERELERHYSLEAVPWVMFFHEAYALHAAFWHDRFGQRRSHGCVNLSPRDARTVFELTTPTLPAGYYAILPTESDPGTRVVVR